ncbi:MAG: DNA-directed RNA polymerase subunit alpha [Oscillospiraceae bacterium]|nr:DNA-directed RNA polymerase subunit alpha [Oscillospiraceae bacterium]
MIDIDKTNVEVCDVSEDGSYGKVIIAPLDRGFGYTLGNSLRRVLLSSLRGAAVTAIKIEGVPHEFSTIQGVKEDVSEIILNVKNMRFKLYGGAPRKLFLEAHGKCNVTAGDIKYDPEIDVLNSGLHIATLSENASLSMELMIGEGKGYSPGEKNKQDMQYDLGSIVIDSIFTPVCKVNYFVENTRVGQVTDYDKLILELWTDGSVEVRDAVSLASKTLIDHFELLLELSSSIGGSYRKRGDAAAIEQERLYGMTLEEMDLSVRAFNCLKRVGISHLRDLLNMSEEDIMKIKNLGKKSLTEVIAKINALGFRVLPDADVPQRDFGLVEGRAGEVNSPEGVLD